MTMSLTSSTSEELSARRMQRILWWSSRSPAADEAHRPCRRVVVREERRAAGQRGLEAELVDLGDDIDGQVLGEHLRREAGLGDEVGARGPQLVQILLPRDAGRGRAAITMARSQSCFASSSTILS
jgi:hypothetical protein